MQLIRYNEVVADMIDVNLTLNGKAKAEYHQLLSKNTLKD